MSARRISLTVLGLVMMMFLHINTGTAEGNVNTFFSDTASKVKATAEPAQKRDILEKSFRTMSEALDMVQSSALISNEDRAGVDIIRTALQEKQDELLGLNGFERVSDSQLDAFSDYVVQDMEQAAETVTIGLISALLIIIIIILVVG